MTLAACYLVVGLKRRSMKNMATNGLNAIGVKTSRCAGTLMNLITVPSVTTGALQTMESYKDMIACTTTSKIETCESADQILFQRD